jgi:hypothetical protein
MVTESNMLSIGLCCAGFKEHRVAKWTEKSQIDKFKTFYGSRPIVVSKIYNDLQEQAATGNSASLAAGKIDISNLLMAMWFLKRYPTELEIQAKFDVSEKTARKKVWALVQDIQALKSIKVSLLGSIIYNL